MMAYQEKIAPPLAPLTDEQQVALLVEALFVQGSLGRRLYCPPDRYNPGYEALVPSGGASP